MEAKKTGPITTQTSIRVIKVPKDRQGTTLHVSGDFNGATLTAGYLDANGDITDYADTAAVLTAAGEIRIQAGNGVEIFVTTTVADPTGIYVLASVY